MASGLLSAATLVGLAALSMCAPALVGMLVPRPFNWISLVAPLPIAVVWFCFWGREGQRVGHHHKWVLWYLLLVPFVLCYPGWAIILMCGVIFNRGGPQPF